MRLVLSQTRIFCPPAPPPAIGSILQKFGKIQNQLRMAWNGEKSRKKILPLGDPPPEKNLEKFSKFFWKLFRIIWNVKKIENLEKKNFSYNRNFSKFFSGGGHQVANFFSSISRRFRPFWVNSEFFWGGEGQTRNEACHVQCGNKHWHTTAYFHGGRGCDVQKSMCKYCIVDDHFDKIKRLISSFIRKKLS